MPERSSHRNWVPRCPGCEYDLSATPGHRCPECGALFDRKTVFKPPARASSWSIRRCAIAVVLCVMCGSAALGTMIVLFLILEALGAGTAEFALFGWEIAHLPAFIAGLILVATPLGIWWFVGWPRSRDAD